ncbi:MAG: hypothetical protein ABUS51_00845 [Acidobacteriota bacterium]
MVAATALAVFIVPVLFVVIDRFKERGAQRQKGAQPGALPAPSPAGGND